MCTSCVVASYACSCTHTAEFSGPGGISFRPRAPLAALRRSTHSGSGRLRRPGPPAPRASTITPLTRAARAVRPAPGGRCADRGPRSVRGARRPGAPAPRRCAAVRGAGGRAGRRQARALGLLCVMYVWCAVRPGPEPRISDVRAEPIRVVWSPPCMSVPLSSNQHVTRSTGPRSRARAEPPSRS